MKKVKKTKEPVYKKLVKFELIDVYRHSNAQKKNLFLYDLLKTRMDEPHINISHTKMPSPREHTFFISSRPYRCWFIIQVDNEWVGSAYVTKGNEIGVYLLEAHRVDDLAIAITMDLMEMGGIYINTNPQDTDKIRYIKKMGFKLIQHTYIRSDKI